MKHAHLKVPRGWRLLKLGTQIAEGDKWDSGRLTRWMSSSGPDNGKVGYNSFRYIRKTLKVPKGWRILRRGTTIKEGDKFDCIDGWVSSFIPGNVVGGMDHIGRVIRYIRRIRRK